MSILNQSGGGLQSECRGTRVTGWFQLMPPACPLEVHVDWPSTKLGSNQRESPPSEPVASTETDPLRNPPLLQVFTLNLRCLEANSSLPLLARPSASLGLDHNIIRAGVIGQIALIHA
jgi:hypothetical protein